uniref:NUDE_C domain-containing protein n=1 Tax=Gongylonema pulchrum TaxID=637853 RepID=A0A183EM70_9BILA
LTAAHFRAEEAKAELKEFVASSRLLEIELDKELTETKLSLSKRDKEVATLRRERERFQDRCRRLEEEMRDLKHVGQLASRQPGAASAISSASTSNNHIPSPVSQGRRSTDAVSQSVKLVRNGFTSPEKYEKCSQDAVEKKSPTNANPKSIGPLVNALPPPLASNVSSVLGDLLGTIQALEEKLLLLHPERKAAACDNGFGPNRRS